MKNTIIILFVLGVIGAGTYWFMSKQSSEEIIITTETIKDTTNQNQSATGTKNPTTQPVTTAVDTTKTVLGTSVKNNPITAYHFGTGTDEILFVGGIHGGYEWNTVLVAYELMDYLKANPTAIPKNIKVTVIPVVNPDGLQKVTGTTERFTAKDIPSTESVVISGRFNANTVDLNRNFDCDWQKTGVWQTKQVSGGSAAFSEPESLAIKNYVEKNKPKAAVVWYSAGGGVFASNCHTGVSQETNTLTQKFATASGYPAHQSFDFYATTGDMVNWLAKNSIPAISVLLTNHTDTEWIKNKAGVIAILKHYTR